MNKSLARYFILKKYNYLLDQHVWKKFIIRMYNLLF